MIIKVCCFIILLLISNSSIANNKKYNNEISEKKGDNINFCRKNNCENVNILDINNKRGNLFNMLVSRKHGNFNISDNSITKNIKNQFPGFSLLNEKNNSNEILFRGMFGSRIGIINEGNEILGACISRMDNINTYLSFNSIDSISLIKGPQTVLYKSGNYAGTLNFRQKSPEIYFPTLLLNFKFLINSRGIQDNNLDFIMGNKLGYIRINKGILYKYSFNNKKDKLNKNNNTVTLSVKPSTNNLTEIKINSSYENMNFILDNIISRRKSINLKTKQYINNIMKYFAINLWYHNLKHIMEKSQVYSNSNLELYGNTKRILYGLRFINNINLGYNQYIKNGVDLILNKHFKKDKNYLLEDACFFDKGIFAEIYLKNYRYDIIGGIRLENTRVDSKNNNRLENYTSSFLRLENNKNSILSFIDYIGFGINNRFPDYWELMSKRSNIHSNKSFYTLKKEQVLQLDIGISKKYKNFEFWTTAFINRIINYIIFNHNKYNSSRVYAKNINAKTKGGEISFSYHVNKNINFENNLSLCLGENTENKKPLPRIPPPENNSTIRWKNTNMNVSFTCRTVLPQKRISPYEGNLISKDLQPSLGFMIFSIYSTYNNNNGMKLHWGIDNIFNKKYKEHLSFIDFNNTNLNENGISAWIKTEISF